MSRSATTFTVFGLDLVTSLSLSVDGGQSKRRDTNPFFLYLIRKEKEENKFFRFRPKNEMMSVSHRLSLSYVTYHSISYESGFNVMCFLFCFSRHNPNLLLLRNITLHSLTLLSHVSVLTLWHCSVHSTVLYASACIQRPVVHTVRDSFEIRRWDGFMSEVTKVSRIHVT